MTLIKYNNRPSLLDEMNHWIENLSIQTPINFYNKSISWVPQFEVREIDDSYQIFAELPGMNKKNINIEVTDGFITIMGEKPEDKKKDNQHYSEISYGKFERKFKLPKDIMNDGVSAKMKDGILAVFIPKMEPVKAEVTKIAVK
jgi:HSP20 family protein